MCWSFSLWGSRPIWAHTAEQYLRHAFASLLLAFGYMIPCVSQQLGHSSAKITLDTYGHILEEGHRLDREATLQRFENGATRVLLRQEVPGAETAKTPDKSGAGDRTRTDDLRITRTQSSLPFE